MVEVDEKKPANVFKIFRSPATRARGAMSSRTSPFDPIPKLDFRFPLSLPRKKIDRGGLSDRKRISWDKKNLLENKKDVPDEEKDVSDGKKTTTEETVDTKR